LQRHSYSYTQHTISHTDIIHRPLSQNNNPDSPDLTSDPPKSDVPEQNGISGSTEKLSLRDEILNVIDAGAPKTKFHSLTPKAIHELIRLKYPQASADKIFDICMDEYEKDRLIKNGPGFRYNDLGT